MRADLDVDYVLEGSLLSNADGLRVVTRLVAASEERPVWQGEFAGAVYEGRAWRREIGRGVARQLDISDDVAAPEPERLVSPDARLAYLKARHSLAKPGAEAAAGAAAYFAEAVDADPRYAPALSGLAEARFRSGDLNGAREAAQRALALDSRLAEAHRVLGAVLLVGDRDLAASGPHFEQAASATSRPEDHQAYAFYLFLHGEPEAGLEQARAAFSVDPLSAVLQGDVGVFHLWAGEPEQAFVRCSLAAELDPERAWAYRCLITALDMMGRGEDMPPYLRRLMRLEGADPADIRSVIATPADRRSSAYRRWRIADLEARGIRSGADRLALARLCAAEGDLERALGLLEQAASDPPLGYPTISVDPAFRRLATDPRFQRLLDELWLG